MFVSGGVPDTAGEVSDRQEIGSGLFAQPRFGLGERPGSFSLGPSFLAILLFFSPLFLPPCLLPLTFPLSIFSLCSFHSLSFMCSPTLCFPSRALARQSGVTGVLSCGQFGDGEGDVESCLCPSFSALGTWNVLEIFEFLDFDLFSAFLNLNQFVVFLAK